MRQRPPASPAGRIERINIRVSGEERAMLTELRDVLQASTDSACVRAIIRLHYDTMRAERARLRRARRARG